MDQFPLSSNRLALPHHLLFGQTLEHITLCVNDVLNSITIINMVHAAIMQVISATLNYDLSFQLGCYIPRPIFLRAEKI